MTLKTITAEGVFWIELLKSIYKQQLIFRVDEWSCTKAVKAEYSWLPVDKSWVVINDLCKGSSSLIMAAESNGRWFGII